MALCGSLWLSVGLVWVFDSAVLLWLCGSVAALQTVLQTVPRPDRVVQCCSGSCLPDLPEGFSDMVAVLVCRKMAPSR